MSVKAAKPSARTAVPTSPPADKDVASLQVSLPQMLDLALGTPEVGAVNLNILHNFLHILLHQINLRSTKVEYRGDDANRIKTMVGSLKAGPSLYLQEYNIIDASSNVKERVRSSDAINVKVDVLMEESIVKDSKELIESVSAPVTQREKSKEEQVTPYAQPTEGEDLKKTKGVRQEISSGSKGECETVILVEPIIDGATPTALAFKQLEQNVNELQQRFQALEDLSTTPELIERLKGKITDPVTDVWQIINITKRLDASEQGIDKLTKMVQDVIKGDTVGEASNLEERIANIEYSLSNLDQVVKNLQIIAKMDEDEGAEAVITEIGEEKEQPESEQPVQRISLSQLLGEKVEAQEKAAVIEKPKHLTETTQEDVETKHTEETEEAVKPVEKAVTSSKEIRTGSPKKPAESKQTEEVLDSGGLQVLKERISKLEKDVSCLYEKVESAPMAGVVGAADVEDLVSKINEIQSDMEKMNQTADRLIDDRENREMHLNALLEQVELLKTIKADREDLEDALADKADAQAIHRKVSYDQFDAACDDLAQGLEDAINKLGHQEMIWQQALDEVQKEIEGKVDKMEMSPLKDFVNNRLKTLQDKLKKVAEARQEIEAAGTKKLLRDVQCISCDKDVVMRMDGGHKFKVETLPCTVSMKPYLTYELDQVRKQHRRLPHSRNMIQFEAAVQEEARKQKSARTDTLVKTPRDHLCNRYCGGSHTITTPQQRVMRVGHFLTQWGPEIVQLTEGMIKGTDGKMYKSRRMPDKIDVCGPAYCDERDDLRSTDRQSISSVPSRNTVKQASSNSRKRIVKRHSREINKEIIEEFVETPVTETEDQESVGVPIDTAGPGDRVVRYREEEEMGEPD
ncbi:Glutamine-rich protein 2 [Eufriesea mexicana]|uniref:Glutamine-rich protein 2 n=1 Tax=Eufriesea mexicana TaxID=516756 RepID=A0A310SPK5_9HYME|nr:Glutamine-rich protein 2 [Eufriesea mexicana]